MITNDQQEKFYIKLGETIKHYRLLKKINQEDLGQQVGLSRVSIVNIEKGIQKVQVHNLFEIANFLNFSMDELIPFAISQDDISTKSFDRNIIKESMQLNDKGFGKTLFEDFIKLSLKKNSLNNGTKD